MRAQAVLIAVGAAAAVAGGVAVLRRRARVRERLELAGDLADAPGFTEAELKLGRLLGFVEEHEGELE